MRNNLDDLAAFAQVAKARSFTRAAAALGVSQSALSHTMRSLEQRLGLRLLARTTRSVGLTEAGQQLLERLGPALEDIGEGLAAVARLRDRPAGRVRITCSRHAAETVLWPVIDQIMTEHPDIHVELSLDGSLVDIVRDGFDAGVRLGEQVERDMISRRIGPDLRFAVVASPEYLAGAGMPSDPRDLVRHRCINLRMATRGNLYAWEFDRQGQSLNVQVEGGFIANDTELARRAALAGHGLACLFEDLVSEDLNAGRLVRVLDEWCEPFVGHHIYYPSRRQPSAAFAVVIDALATSRDRPRDLHAHR